jgi:hypothetical protein
MWQLLSCRYWGYQTLTTIKANVINATNRRLRMYFDRVMVMTLFIPCGFPGRPAEHFQVYFRKGNQLHKRCAG